MTTVGLIALVIALLANAAAVLLAGFLCWWSNRKVAVAIEVVHHATNSMKDELVAAVRAAALAKGRADAEDEAKDRGDVRGETGAH